jgi:hypothetical protein
MHRFFIFDVVLLVQMILKTVKMSSRNESALIFCAITYCDFCRVLYLQPSSVKSAQLYGNPRSRWSKECFHKLRRKENFIIASSFFFSLSNPPKPCSVLFITKFAFNEFIFVFCVHVHIESTVTFECARAFWAFTDEWWFNFGWICGCRNSSFG